MNKLDCNTRLALCLPSGSHVLERPSELDLAIERSFDNTDYAIRVIDTGYSTIHALLHESADGDLQTVTYGPITERARLTAASASLLLHVHYCWRSSI